MIKKTTPIISYFKKQPRLLFLIDGIGALTSALLLIVVLPSFEEIFEMPQPMLYMLACIALFLGSYSFCCFYLSPKNWPPYMLAIAVANFIYCLVTLSLVFYFFEALTSLGITYFIVECFIIGILSGIEIKVGMSEKVG